MKNHTMKKGQVNLADLAEQITAYENGELEHEQIIELYTVLIRSGIINDLQGSYQRTAIMLISAGLIEGVK